MRFGKILIILLGLLVLVFWVVIFFRSRSRIVSPIPKSEPVSNIPAEVWPSYKILGQSLQGRPIESYTFGAGEKQILFVGGIHGGYEWNTVLLAYQLIDYLKVNKAKLPAGLQVTIIPTLNPDGVFRVTGKVGRFALSDVSLDQTVLAAGRFNAYNVDLNRNFDCSWQPESMWRSAKVSAGSAAFSEPESAALRDWVLVNHPRAVIFWHSAANTVYASQCGSAALPDTLAIMDQYAQAASYGTAATFDSYQVTGDASDWLASLQIPAITVELQTHESVEWEQNLAGVQAVLQYYSQN